MYSKKMIKNGTKIEGDEDDQDNIIRR